MGVQVQLSRRSEDQSSSNERYVHLLTLPMRHATQDVLPAERVHLAGCSMDNDWLQV